MGRALVQKRVNGVGPPQQLNLHARVGEAGTLPHKRRASSQARGVPAKQEAFA